MAIPRKGLKGLGEGFDEKAVQELVALYEAAARRLRSIAEQRLIGGELTSTAKKARMALLEVEAVLRDLDDQAAAWISEYIPAAYRRGAAETLKGLKEIGFAGPIRFDPKFHEEAVQILMLDMQDRLSAATDTVRRTFRTTIRRTQLEAITDRQLSGIIAKSQITGETSRQLAKNIKKQLIDKFGEGPIKINGRNYQMDKYAELVARTKTREAVTAGEINRCIEAGQDLVIVTNHNTDCEICAFFEGRVFSISGTSDKYPAIGELLNGGPPFHPNCLHNIVPFVEEYASPTEIRRGMDIDERVLGKTQKEISKIAAR